MNNALKQLFFGRERFPSITCSICNSEDEDIWLHILLKCNHHHIHAKRAKRHNKEVWELTKFILSSQESRCYTLMNFQQQPPIKHSTPWLVTCSCEQQRCQCNARFKQDILCIKGHPFNSDPPSYPSDNFTIRFIELTYCNDRFPQETIVKKIQKYQSLINNIIGLGWKIDPFIVITAGVRGTTHPFNGTP